VRRGYRRDRGCAHETSRHPARVRDGSATVASQGSKATKPRRARTLLLKGQRNYVVYAESPRLESHGEHIFIGYRYYDQRCITPLFPFGHGLSYTTFKYSDLTIADASAAEAERGVLRTASATLKNTGSRLAKEIVQLYVGEAASRLLRPPKELRHFTKLELQPGQSRELRFELRARDFAYYDVHLHDWVIDSGVFHILCGGSSRGPLLSESTHLVVPRPYPPLTRDSTLKGKFTERDLQSWLAQSASAEARAGAPSSRRRSTFGPLGCSHVPSLTGDH
jgi:Fibronectin type III-like domain